jgi:nucleoid-associated protein YgaU
MKRITLILGVVAVMVAMLVALAAPAMAKDNGGNNNGGGHNNGGINNRVDNDLGRLDNGLDNRVDLDQGDFFEPPIPPVMTEAVDTTTVEPGDTLFGIAQEQLGPDAPPELIPDQVNTIHNLNRDVIGDNPHMIFPGQHLRMPSHR